MDEMHSLFIPNYEELSGIPFKIILEKLSIKFNNLLIPKYAELHNNNFVLTLDGWFICDYIVEQIFEITKEIQNDYKKNF